MLTIIVGILLGNVLVAILFAPSLQKLRDLMGKFSGIQLPYRPMWSDAKQLTATQRHDAVDVAVREFNRLFREYVIAFNTFKKVGAVLVVSIVALVCAIAWNMPWGFRPRLIAMAVAIVTIVLVLAFLQRVFAPSPAQLVSIDFLQNNFSNLHLDALFECSRLLVSYGRPLGTRDPVMHFTLIQEMLFLDYKLLLAISNAECSRIHFVAYGPIASRSEFRQYWTPEIANFSVPLGDFSYSDALLSSRFLTLHLWLFIPTPTGWVKEKSDNPRFLTDELTVEMGGQIGSPLVSSKCSWNSIDAHVDFDRRSFAGFTSWNISRVNVPTDNSPQAIVRMYKEQIEHSKSIKSEDYPEGIGIKKTPRK